MSTSTGEAMNRAIASGSSPVMVLSLFQISAEPRASTSVRTVPSPPSAAARSPSRAVSASEVPASWVLRPSSRLRACSTWVRCAPSADEKASALDESCDIARFSCGTLCVSASRMAVAELAA
nr:hypothetical protein [Microbacterium ihumii]